MRSLVLIFLLAVTMMGCSKSEGIIWYGEVSGEYDGWGWNEAPVVIYTTDHNNRFGISIGEERPLEFDIRNHSGNGVNHVYRLHMVKDKGEWVSVASGRKFG